MVCGASPTSVKREACKKGRVCTMPCTLSRSHKSVLVLTTQYSVRRRTSVCCGYLVQVWIRYSVALSSWVPDDTPCSLAAPISRIGEKKRVWWRLDGCSHQRWVEYARAIWMDPKITETRRRWLRGCHSMNDSRGEKIRTFVVVVSQRL